MSPKSEAVVLIQKRLWDEATFGAVKGNRTAVVDLNRVDAVARPNCPVYLHVRTCLIIRRRVVAVRVCIITLNGKLTNWCVNQ